MPSIARTACKCSLSTCALIVSAVCQVRSGVTFGLPSASPPIHEPRMIGDGESSGLTPVALRKRPVTAGTASHNVVSKVRSNSRDSSSTVGRR